jgi:hypothetical protein
MKDCILALVWPREHIIALFEKHGWTKPDVADVRQFKELALTRAAIVDRLFERANARADGGLGPMRALLQSLLTWSHFDPYYFDKLKKLDRSIAEKQLVHLRQVQEIRDARIREDQQARRARADAQQLSTSSLPTLTDSFQRIVALQPHLRSGKSSTARVLAHRC